MKSLQILILSSSLILVTACSSSAPEVDETIQPIVENFTLSVEQSEGGTIDNNGGRYENGSSVTITAIPDSEYLFTNWSNGATDNPLTLTINNDISISAVFEKRQYPLSIYISGQGSVSETIITSSKTPTDYDAGSLVRLTANPSSGWMFSNWSGSVSSTTNPIELTINETKNVTVTFSLIASSEDDSSDSQTSTSTTSSDTTSSDTSSTTYTTALTPFTNPDAGFGIFTKKVVVFDVPLYGTNQVDDAKLSHAANVMAQYLDNDEDGTPDNPLVVEALKSNNGFMLVWKNESDLNIFDSLANPDAGQDLGADETIPEWHTNGQTGQFDATLEEVLHLITHIGYHNAYPNEFGETIGSEIANAMDIARGGQFTSIPSSYPASAWYTYDDDSCDYACQVTEYVFWALTSILGAHDNRLGEIDQEWLLNTNAKVQQTDTQVYQLLTDPRYAFPTVLPDGQYQQ